MKFIGTEELKNRLGETIRPAASGEAVLVTDCGRVGVELTAPRVHAGASAAEQRMGKQVREGRLVPAKVPPKARLPRRKPVIRIGEVLRDLDASRAER